MARDRLHATLGAVGLVAWALYLLGCGWTAWSPDGSSVLALRQEADEVSAFSVDVRTGATKLLASLAPGSGTYAFGQWDRSGRRAILVGGAMSRGSSVLVVPAAAGAPIREFLIEYGENEEPTRFPPPFPQVGAELFIPGPLLQRLNLDTGAIARRKAFEKKQRAMLFQRGDRVGYVAFLEKEVVLGDVDPADLSLRKRYGIPLDELGPEGASLREPLPFVAVTEDRIAFVARFKDGPDRIVVLGPTDVDRVLPTALPAGLLPGNLQWSRDGRTLYAAVLGPAEEEGLVQCSAAVIRPGSPEASPRLIPIARFRVAGEASRQDVEDLWPYAFQISLSPDGRALAASTGYRFLKKDEGQKAAVSLLDPVGGPAVHIVNLERGTVRRIPLPPPSGGRARAKGEAKAAG